MKKLFIIFLILIPVITSSAQEVYQRTLKLMGSRFDISVVANDSVTAHQYIDTAVAEIARIEKLISSWDPASQTSKINKNAGIKPVEVSPELVQLISRAIGISKLTDGAFDISYASMDKIWKFDGTLKSLPTKKQVLQSVSKVGFQNIMVDTEKSTVFLKEKGMKIGFGAIGKGYAADMAKALLKSKGVEGGIINASGDMSTWGKHPDGNYWKVAIVNPLNKNKVFAMLPVKEEAVVTSGDYEKYISFEGRRYSHIIDPRTGYPSSGIISATVFAPKAEIADALATSIFVMGVSTGLDRVNQLPGIECILIDDKGNIHTSNNIELNRP